MQVGPHVILGAPAVGPKHQGNHRIVYLTQQAGRLDRVAIVNRSEALLPLIHLVAA